MLYFIIRIVESCDSSWHVLRLEALSSRSVAALQLPDACVCISFTFERPPQIQIEAADEDVPADPERRPQQVLTGQKRKSKLQNSSNKYRTRMR